MKIPAPHSSLICFAESDDPSDGGGGDGGAPPEPTPSVDEPDKVSLTRDELDQLLSNAVTKGVEAAAPKIQDSVFAAVRRSGKGKAKSEPAGTPPQKPAEPSEPQIDRAMERRFDRAIGRAEFDLNDRRIEVLERDLAADMPDDVGAWMTERVKDYGWLKSQPETPSAQEPAVKDEPKPEPKAEPKPPGPSPNGAPNALPSLEQFRTQHGIIDVFSLPDDVQGTMPIEDLKGHFEKAAQVSRQASGAPPIPAVLRKGQ